MHTPRDLSEGRCHDYLDSENIIGTVKLEARKGIEFAVGTYEAGLPQPAFRVQTEPESTSHDISASLMRVDHAGEYKLIYYFQNFTDRDYHITVREKET